MSAVTADLMLDGVESAFLEQELALEEPLTLGAA